MSFGDDTGSNGFIGIGSWAVDAEPKDMGVTFSTFIFQLSFATTATTIGLYYTKRSLMSCVVVIPKEGRARGAAPALLLV